MKTNDAFLCACVGEMLCWNALMDLKIMMVYGLIVYFACKHLYPERDGQ